MREGLTVADEQGGAAGADVTRDWSWETVTLGPGTPVDQRGHRSLISEHLLATITRFRNDPLEIPGGEPVMFITGAFPCSYCGAHPSFRLVDGTITARTECEYPCGSLIVTEIDVPSGKMVVSDDLRPEYDVDVVGDDHRRPDFCSSAGRVEHSAAMAALGCAYGPTTNTTVKFYRVGTDRYAIGSPAWPVAEFAGEDVADAMIGQPLAEVSCDVWAYAAADLDAWTALGGRLDRDRGNVSTFEVEPGRYRFTCYTMVRDFDEASSGIILYATFERVGPISTCDTPA